MTEQATPSVPSCAICGSPSTRDYHLVVQLATRRSSPIHLVGSDPLKVLEVAEFAIPVCDDCEIAGHRTVQRP